MLQITMLQNKIYQNFFKEILKTFLVILFGLSLIAITVKAVNFLDLIVENSYSIKTYFTYTLLNFFGVITRFVPLSFLLALFLFIVKQIKDNEFIILWTSGVKKLKVVNLFFISSLFIVCLYILMSSLITPLSLNKSRLLLTKDGFNSFLPTIKVKQFSDSFKGFTFIVDKRFKNQIENVFIYDQSDILQNLTTEDQATNSTTIISSKGIVEEKKMILFDGYILTEKKDFENNLVKFEQLNISLKNLKNNIIEQPKLQETSTFILMKCFLSTENIEFLDCKKDSKTEIITTLNRRFSLPFYIPIVSLICSFLLIKTSVKKNYFLNKYSIFFLSFLVLLYSELVIRFTGLSQLISLIFIFTPVIIGPLLYLMLMFKFRKESLIK